MFVVCCVVHADFVVATSDVCHLLYFLLIFARDALANVERHKRHLTDVDSLNAGLQDDRSHFHSTVFADVVELFVTNGTDVLRIDKETKTHESLYHQVRYVHNN